jgi:ABC-type uncharacterized transport system permease subunit
VTVDEPASFSDLVTVPSPIVLLVAIDAVAGAILATIRGLLRARAG